MRTAALFLLAAGALLAAPAQQSAIVSKAQSLCQSAREKMSVDDWQKGPCVSNDGKELPGWAVDVAHVPREKVDDDAANQCSSVAEGRVDKFIELDEDCRVIRVNGR